MSENPNETGLVEAALRQYAQQVDGEVEEVRAGFLEMVEQNGLETTLTALEENRKLIERMGW